MLIYKDEHMAFKVEAAKICKLNVLTFKLEMGSMHLFVVGCYIAPSNKETAAHVRAAWAKCPKGYRPLLQDNLNASLWEPATHGQMVSWT